MEFSKEDLLRDVTFKASRSGGKGGQHVNKVSSKAELSYDLERSELFAETERARIREKLAGRLSSDGNLRVVSDEERSQLLNREKALEKLFLLLKRALYVPKKRKATRPTKNSVEQRLKDKQQQALKKNTRRKGNFDY